MNKFKIKDNISTIVGITVILLLLILFGKLVVYDCIIGTKIYDDNDIVIRYHRYINIFTAKNNSDEIIYSFIIFLIINLDKYKYDIKYYKKSEDFEIKSGDKYVKFMGIRDDAYLFTIVNEDDLYDTVSYNKHDWFKKY